MALDTYANLQAAVATWAWRTGDTDFTAAVPDMITMVEEVLNYGGEGIEPLRVRDMEMDDTITVTSGVGDLPPDYLQYRTLQYGTPARDLPSSEWSIVGDTIKTTRTDVSPLALGYYAKIPALSDANTTNWLLVRSPKVYLFGALIHAEAFMREDPRMATWGQLFTSALSGLRTSDGMSKFARATSRPKGPTP